MTDLDLIVINNKGRRFGIRLVWPGMGYGVDDKVLFQPGEGHHVHADPDDVMVEFYDYTYATDGSDQRSFGPRGQFVSRYYASTLREDRERLGTAGLCLDGGNADVWSVDVDVMRQVYQLVNHAYARKETAS